MFSLGQTAEGFISLLTNKQTFSASIPISGVKLPIGTFLKLKYAQLHVRLPTYLVRFLKYLCYAYHSVCRGSCPNTFFDAPPGREDIYRIVTNENDPRDKSTARLPVQSSIL